MMMMIIFDVCQVMLGLKQQLVSSWASDGLDMEKLHTKVLDMNIDSSITMAIIIIDIANAIIFIVIPKT